jgi:hypothetical protein
VKKLILKGIHRCGYWLFQKKAFGDKVKRTETPKIEQEWLNDVQLISDRKAVLHKLPKMNKMAEVGVGYGDFSKTLIGILQPSEFVAIDTFDGDASDKWGKPLQEHNMTHLNYYLHNTDAKNLPCTLSTIQGLSWEVLSGFETDYFDYIYIDADHSYDCVKKDITAAASRIKLGGYMQCNDFTHFDTDNMVHYGVPRAVLELVQTGTYKMRYLCLETRGYYDVVLQRVR